MRKWQTELLPDLDKLGKDEGWKELCSQDETLDNNWTEMQKALGEAQSKLEEVLDANGKPKPKSHLEVLQKRLKQDEIYIGIFGTVSCGKSTFLQALTGLTGNYLPTDTRKCTATSTNIHWAKEKKAEVFFHTKDTLKKVILNQIRELCSFKIAKEAGCNYENDFKVFEDKHKQLDELISEYNSEGEGEGEGKSKSKIKNLITTIIKGDTVNGGCAVTLEGYLEKYDVYKHLLDTPFKPLDEWQIDNGELKVYVARQDSDIYYAVAHVELYCKFTSLDLSGLVLKDTMGYGEDKAGLGEALLDEMKTQCDEAILLWDGAKEWRTDEAAKTTKELHKLIAESNLPLPKLWLRCIYNIRTKGNYHGDNIADCIDNINVGKTDEDKIKPEDTRMLDATDREKVKEVFKEFVLGSLIKNIQTLDAAHLKAEYEQIDKVEGAIKELMSCMNRIVVKEIDEDGFIDSEITKLFKDIRVRYDTVTREATKNKDKVYSECKSLFRECVKEKNAIEEMVPGDYDVDKYLEDWAVKTNELQAFHIAIEGLADTYEKYVTQFGEGYIPKLVADAKNNLANAILKAHKGAISKKFSYREGLDGLKQLRDSIENPEFSDFVKFIDEWTAEVQRLLKDIFKTIRDEVTHNVELKYSNLNEAYKNMKGQVESMDKSFKEKLEKFLNKDIFNGDSPICTTLYKEFYTRMFKNDGDNLTACNTVLRGWLKKNQSIFDNNKLEAEKKANNTWAQCLKKARNVENPSTAVEE